MAKLKLAPVCYTLAQMRFNTVLDIDSVLPSLQEEYGKQGFPDFVVEKRDGVEVRQEAETLSVHQKRSETYVFRNKEKTAALLLSSGSLTYELTNYPVFKEFSECFLSALGALNNLRPIEFYDRLGMRMLDVIRPREGEGVGAYVVPQAQGFENPLAGGSTQLTLTESVYTQEAHTVVSRTIKTQGGVRMPPDLSPMRLELEERFKGGSGELVMLDTDSFFERRETDFQVATVKQELASLKSALSKNFKLIVTEHALGVWE
jgi:uncharacterized protein (TIGR04255 family)